MDYKERFIQIYKDKIHREGSEQFLNYLTSSHSDFFTAPASSRYHYSFKGGLCAHSLNVYDCLVNYLQHLKKDFNIEYDEESIAIVALLHDVCKINCYEESVRNKKENGNWIQVPYYEFNDKMPYGHGEKSVYMISGYMRLSREEAFAIRYHMGFSNNDDVRNVGASFEMYPLAFALSTADMEATYLIESKDK